MQTTFSATFKNHISEVTKLHSLLERFGRTHHIPEIVVSSMNLALEEIFANIISYGYQDTLEHDILLRLSLEGKELIAEVEDDGQPFNPLKAPSPNVTLPLEDRPLGGLGIHLIKQLSYGSRVEILMNLRSRPESVSNEVAQRPVSFEPT